MTAVRNPKRSGYCSRREADKLIEQGIVTIDDVVATNGSRVLDGQTVLVDGKDITKMPLDERSKLGIGFSFQQPVRFKGLKVKDLLSIKNEDKDINILLEQVGLDYKKYLDIWMI